MHKKIISLLGIMFFLVACFSFLSHAKAGELPYPGYYSDDYTVYFNARYLYDDHFEAAYWMKQWNIFNGYEDGSFGALNEVNRAELAKVLVLSTGVTIEEVEVAVGNYDTENGTGDYFPDLETGAWYVPYVRYAQIQGWVSGYPNGNYGPADPVLISEALKMIFESQYGTPGDQYAGDNWYDVYLNAVLELNLIYSDSGYLYYNFDMFSDIVGFDATVGGKATRKDIAELIYRVYMILDLGEGELAYYNPLISLEEYQEIYGAIIKETEEGILSISDPYFGFEIENVYIADFDISELRIYIKDPSGSENGWFTDWRLMYPTSMEYDGLGYNNLFYITILDEDYSNNNENFVVNFNYFSDTYSNYDYITAKCVDSDDWAVDLWYVYDSICEESEDIEEVLRLAEYGSVYAGEEKDLNLSYKEQMSVLEYGNDIHYFVDIDLMMNLYDLYLYGFAWQLEEAEKNYYYLKSLTKLQSEDDSQEEVFASWLDEYEDIISSYSELFDNEELYLALKTAEAELKSIFTEYEQNIIRAYGETMVLNVVPTDIDEGEGIIYYSGGYVDCPEGGCEIIVTSDYGGDYLWGAFGIILSDDSEFDIWDGDLVATWAKITINVEPILVEEDEILENHLYVIQDGNFINSYYYEIIDVEWGDELELE